MTKTNKLRMGIFAIALMLLFQTNAWSQSAKQTSAPATITSSSPESDRLRKEIADMKAKRDMFVSEKKISQKDLDVVNSRIATLEGQLKQEEGQLNQTAAKKQQNAAPSPSFSNVSDSNPQSGQVNAAKKITDPAQNAATLKKLQDKLASLQKNAGTMNDNVDSGTDENLIAIQKVQQQIKALEEQMNKN